jgi:hypothetical protein
MGQRQVPQERDGTGQQRVGGEAYDFGLDVRQGVGQVVRVRDRDREEPVPLDQADRHRHRSVRRERGWQAVK